MHLRNTRLHILSRQQNLASKARTGVSLHCHTEHSKEMLDFVPHYAAKLPIIAYFWKREKIRYELENGPFPDFSTAFWSPPLKAVDVYDIERDQINRVGLDAVVSLSDHDSIDANLRVHEELGHSNAPISLEWTVPYDIGFFHVGVHNLPKENAAELTQTLLEFTFNKENHSNAKLNQMFSMLNELPGVLVVLNHPLWDIEMIGKARHVELLKDFIREHGRWIHALEINGFRAWSENKAVIEMAEALGIPIVTGGDRHGCKPNTVINLSNSETFEEFAEEIRVAKHSEVVLMPEYRHPIHSRQLQSFSEILRVYPHFEEGRQRWFDRVHVDVRDGRGILPLASQGMTKGGPKWLRAAIWTLGVFGSPVVRPAFRIARKGKDRVPRDMTSADFEIPDLSEIRRELASETA